MTGTVAFEIQEATRHGWARLMVCGELDLSTALTFRRQVRALRADATDVYLDLSRLEFIDCVGMHALNDVLAESRQGGWRVEIAPEISAQARRFFKLLADAGVPSEL